MTLTDSTIDVDAAIARYFAAWNEPDPDKRKVLVHKAWAVDARSVDPLADVTGRDAICDMIGAVHQQFPGVSVHRSTDVDHHHDLVRFGWEILDADETVAVAGIDIARVDQDGQVVELLGFFGEPAGR